MEILLSVTPGQYLQLVIALASILLVGVVGAGVAYSTLRASIAKIEMTVDALQNTMNAAQRRITDEQATHRTDIDGVQFQQRLMETQLAEIRTLLRENIARLTDMVNRHENRFAKLDSDLLAFFREYKVEKRE